MTYEIGTSIKSSTSVTRRSSTHLHECIDRSSELTTDSTGNSQARVSISKEASRVLLDLADVEAVSGILSVGQQASLEGTLLAADTAANAIANINGVGESNSGRTRGTLGSLVDVCGCGGGR